MAPLERHMNYRPKRPRRPARLCVLRTEECHWHTHIPMAIFEENGNLREPPGDIGSANPDCLRYRIYRSAPIALHYLPDVGGVRLRGGRGSSNPDCLRYRIYRSALTTLHHLPDVGGVRLRGGRGSANPVCLRYRIYLSAPTGIHRLPDVITHQSMMRKLRRHLLPNWPGRNNQRTQSRNTGVPLARRI